ncbi:N-acetylmuramoyl-L-alanine amidase [Akkermansiaceae bacterium]|nr:N-acetylmuramoyl-L-alanine amidase [Akkermansiaceae bacterium]
MLTALLALSGCGSSHNNLYHSGPPVSSYSLPSKSPSSLYREANVQRSLIAKYKHGRKFPRVLNPRYITIHSTQNYTAGAWQHSKALHNGALKGFKRPGGNRTGYLTWHFTVDQDVAVQHLPMNEQGEHADFDGPGNNFSLAIEMCEHHGNSRAATLERTAKLTAWLMYTHNIPIDNVVPHYHWRRKGIDPEHKNCPHFLLDNGRPGAKWRQFQSQINSHYKAISG